MKDNGDERGGRKSNSSKSKSGDKDKSGKVSDTSGNNSGK